MYLAVRQQLIDEGKVASITEECRLARVSRSQVWKWRKDPVFLKLARACVLDHLELDFLDTDRAAIRRAKQGSPKHYELLLRRRSLYNDPIPPALGDATGPAAVAQANVIFVGIPKPPTEEEAQRLRPGPGQGVFPEGYTPPGTPR